ncbi:MAG: YncE family protein [Planctomycetota bacterium]|jgi:hypothetical protein
MSRSQILNTLVLAGLASTVSCFNLNQGDSPLESDPFATSDTMNIVEVTNGFGRLLPYVVPVADPISGLPTAQLVEIRSIDDLLNNPPTVLNPIKPPAAWPTTAINPSSQIGNHYVAVKFSRSLLRSSVLDKTAAGLANNGLTGAITVVAYDQATGESTPITGRGFINGKTYFGTGPDLEHWVRKDGNSGVTARTITRNGTEFQPGVGFPGTDDADNGIVNGGFIGAGSLISPNTFVFVVDTDDNLSTYEAFPTDRVIRVIIKGSEDGTGSGSIVGGVKSLDQRFLEQGGVATSTVGADLTDPSPLLDGLGGSAVTSPSDLASDLPCDQEIRYSFDEACQPYSIGPLPGLVPPALSNEFTVEFLPPVSPGSPPPGSTVQLPYTVLPVSPFNFTEYIITPVVSFPGSDPFGAQAQATVTFFHNAAFDLYLNNSASSLDSTAINFSVGSDCPGLVNVPVAPGAIIVASNGGGVTGGIRVIDLDGFGQGTGDPTFDTANPFYNVTFNEVGDPVSGDVTKFPFNPNLAVGGVFPPLSADTTSIAGGSRGVFTLAQDSTLRTQLVTTNEVGTVADMLLGQPLDIAFNNFECLSGGKNLCASAAFQVHPLAGLTEGNSISHAPHPNPPRIQLAPACFAPLIQTEEPTQGAGGGSVLIVDGDAFGTIGGNGPSGLLTSSANYNGFFGPAPTQPGCPTFVLRQQIGHFLYVLDTSGEQVVVLNSNRMSVIDRIPVSSPRDMAISPDLELLAVSNNGPNTVTFIDIDPNSPTFHTAIKTTDLVDVANARTGLGPTEIVWQPDGEDILTICERSGSMAIIAAAGLETRKIIPGVSNPKFLAVTDRGNGFGFSTGLYYAYVISEAGEMKIFESGPDGLQGIGFDDFVGQPSLDGRTGFTNPSAILMDPSSNQHNVFVAYSDGGQGVVDALWLDNAPFGAVSLRIAPGVVVDPNRRDKEWKLLKQYREVFSSSAIIDLAVDDLSNSGGTPQALAVTIGGTVSHSGKGMHRGATPVSNPKFLFAANSNGLVDVIDLNTGVPRVNPIRVAGVSVLCHYWRQ